MERTISVPQSRTLQDSKYQRLTDSLGLAGEMWTWNRDTSPERSSIASRFLPRRLDLQLINSALIVKTHRGLKVPRSVRSVTLNRVGVRVPRASASRYCPHWGQLNEGMENCLLGRNEWCLGVFLSGFVLIECSFWWCLKWFNTPKTQLVGLDVGCPGCVGFL